MNFLDRAIGYVSPIRGAKRAAARVAMQQLAYEGARKGRRTEGWYAHGTSADAESQAVVGTLRDRARDLVRNNPYAAAACDVKVTETIGAGIVAEIPTQRLRDIWNRFGDECDADGKSDLYGLQALVERCRFEAGECLVRFVPRELSAREAAAGVIPMRLRVLEPDYLDQSKDGVIEGRLCRYGIEYDGAGLPSAYWLYDEHPGDASMSSLRRSGLVSRRVSAADVLHVFRRLRPGQTRGVTEFAPVILRMRDLDDYDDAEVMRKKIEAVLAAFVTSPTGGASPIGPVSTDATGRIEKLFPGMVSYLKPGEGITFSDPKASGGYADFQRFGLRAIATGTGIPYELMTGDLSQVNYSSYRAGLIRFRRRLEQDQYQILVPMLCAPIWRRVLEDARAVLGQPTLGERTRIEWTPPRFELVDPLKETQAEIEAIQAGLDTWPEVVRRRGWVAEEQLDMIEQWQKKLTTRGIVLTSDPRTAIAAKAAAETAPPREREEDEEAA